MTIFPSQATLLVIGSDSVLAYLFTRFAEQGGFQMVQRTNTPFVKEVRQLQPAAIIFASLRHLQTAQSLIEDMLARETLVIVCTSVADELRARELGADACLFHPLTYESFLAALSVGSPQTKQIKSGFQAKISGF